MSAEAQTGAEDDVWKALADPTRRQLLDRLREGPFTTGALCEAVPHLCRTAVMKHLDVLEGAGLLLVRREGRRRWNYLNPVPIQRICERWLTAATSRRSASLLELGRQAERRAQDSEDAGSAPSPHSRPVAPGTPASRRSPRKKRKDPK